MTMQEICASPVWEIRSAGPSTDPLVGLIAAGSENQHDGECSGVRCVFCLFRAIDRIFLGQRHKKEINLGRDGWTDNEGGLSKTDGQHTVDRDNGMAMLEEHFGSGLKEKRGSASLVRVSGGVFDFFSFWSLVFSFPFPFPLHGRLFRCTYIYITAFPFYPSSSATALPPRAIHHALIGVVERLLSSSCT